MTYLNQRDNVKRYNALRHYLPKGIFKNYNVIINENIFYGQSVDSDIKQCEEIRKLTTGQAEDYITGSLLDYYCIKNLYRLVAVDLSRHRIKCWSKSNLGNRIRWNINQYSTKSQLLVEIWSKN